MNCSKDKVEVITNIEPGQIFEVSGQKYKFTPVSDGGITMSVY